MKYHVSAHYFRNGDGLQSSRVIDIPDGAVVLHSFPLGGEICVLIGVPISAADAIRLVADEQEERASTRRRSR
jgi:hypothetical protein